jgi:predicted glycosyl hydrolase (DUF1957 family)
VVAALIAKRMVPCEGHHHMLKKTIDGVTTLITRASHSGPEIRDDLASLMARQCCLTVSEFWQFVECSLSGEQWDAKVRQYCAGGCKPFIGR